MRNIDVEQSDMKESKELALHYIDTIITMARETFLILDSDLRIVLANPVFYENFQVSPKETENNFLYDLGNGQWDIPELKKLLEEILPQNKIVKDFVVKHDFETIGRKVMMLNARQIDTVQLIVLAIEDITSRQNLIDKVEELESVNKNMVGRELKMVELKKEIEHLKKQVKNGNGNHK
jgi:transcriptional regulator with PAS, ATPase and Fis domain